MHDYAAGKMDWLAHGLPYEGAADLVGRHLEQPPVCSPVEHVEAVVERHGTEDRCVVLNEAGVVLGDVDLAGAAGGDRIADVMTTALRTVRPSAEVDELDERLRSAGRDSIVVTRSDGTLLGRYALPA